ncbi:hypothetical protein JMJ77_0004667, partial [Colletotrichum scovillei]
MSLTTSRSLASGSWRRGCLLQQYM